MFELICNTQLQASLAPPNVDPLPAHAGRAISDKELQSVELDMDSWQALQFPSAVLAATVSVKKGVKRAHLVDARVDGA